MWKRERSSQFDSLINLNQNISLNHDNRNHYFHTNFEIPKQFFFDINSNHNANPTQLLTFNVTLLTYLAICRSLSV